jgi:hypothetical protein
VFAWALLFAGIAAAQEDTTEETTALAADAADRKVEAKTDNVSVEVDNGKVSAKTSNASTSNKTTSQQSSLTVQQNQTDEGSRSQVSPGDVNIGASSRARVVVDVLDDNGNRTGEGFTANGGNDATANIPEGPGNFSLDITANNASYKITVEDCDPTCSDFKTLRTFKGTNDRRTDEFAIAGDSFRLRYETDSVNRDRNRHRDHDRDRDRGAAVRQYSRVEEEVIKDTIPDKGTLADTGGTPLVGVAFLALASVGLGLSILRLAIRRDP